MASQGDLFGHVADADPYIPSDMAARAKFGIPYQIKGLRFDAAWKLIVTHATRQYSQLSIIGRIQEAVLRSYDSEVSTAVEVAPQKLPNELEEWLKTEAAKMLRNMRHLAETMFSGGIMDLEISESELKERARFGWIEDHHCSMMEFNPQAAWDWLTDTYGGDAGIQKALGQVAQVLVSGFSLSRHSPTFRNNGCLLLERSMYSEKCKITRKTTYHHSSINSLRTLVNEGIAGFLVHIDREHEAAMVAHRLHQSPLTNSYWNIETRFKLELTSDIKLTVFQSKIEFEFSQAIARQFQIFIAEYGNLGQEAA